MSPLIGARGGYEGGFPRVSGDEPLASLTAESTNWFSPRERG